MFLSGSIRYVKVQLKYLSMFGLDLICYNSDISEFQPVRTAARFLNLKIFLVFATTGGIVLNGGYTLMFLPVGGISHKIFICMFIAAFTTGMCVMVPLLLRPLHYISLFNIQVKLEAGLFKKLGELITKKIKQKYIFYTKIRPLRWILTPVLEFIEFAK